jgi:hypothetical protein
VADPYEFDDQDIPVAEGAGDDPVRRQIETTLRTMALSTVIGLIVIAVIAVVVPSIRGVMIFVFFIYLVTSLTARWYLRRKFLSRLNGPPPGSG